MHLTTCKMYKDKILTAGILLQRCWVSYVRQDSSATSTPLFHYCLLLYSLQTIDKRWPFHLSSFHSYYSQCSPLIIFMFLGIQTTLRVWTPALASQHLMVVTTSFCLGFQSPCCRLISLATGQSVQAHLHSFTPNAAVPRGLALDTLNCSQDTLPGQSHPGWSSDLTPMWFPGVFLISYWASGQHIQSPHNYLLMAISKTAPQIQNKLVTALLKPDAPPVLPVSGNSFWELTLTPFFLMPLYPIHHWILQISFLFTSKVSISHRLPWHYFSPGMLKNSLWSVLSYILWPPSNQSIL